MIKPTKKLRLRRQRGIVLIILLIFLVITTTLITSAMRTTLLDDKMISNFRDQDIAFQAAEAGLLTAENYLLNTTLTTSQFTANCVNGLCIANPVAPVWLTTSNWANAVSVTSLQTSLQTSVAPQYLIELLPSSYGGSSGDGSMVAPINYQLPPPASTQYRITSLGTGKDSNSQVMLQSIYQN